MIAYTTLRTNDDFHETNWMTSLEPLNNYSHCDKNEQLLDNEIFKLFQETLNEDDDDILKKPTVIYSKSDYTSSVQTTTTTTSTTTSTTTTTTTPCVEESLSTTTTNENNSDYDYDIELPPDFKPSPYSVIVGKGKESKQCIGNRRLRVLASIHLPKYVEAANSKRKKSDVVSSLVSIMQDACPVGAFIKLGEDGRWHSVNRCVAREKVGYTFRELLGEKYYKSSSSAKATMRSQKKQQKIRTNNSNNKK